MPHHSVAEFESQLAFDLLDCLILLPVFRHEPDTHGAENAADLPKLKSGQSWEHYFTKHRYQGGASVTVDAPLDEFPLFSLKAAGGGSATALA